MLAARYTEQGFTLEEIARPDPGRGEVLVDLRAAGLCGSDSHYLEAESEFEPNATPVVLGHEGAGVVEATGEGVDSVGLGDRVSLHYVHACGHCTPCLAGADNSCRNRESVGSDLDGTFAEYVVLPEHCVEVMADAVPFSWGAVASCAVATGFHAVRRGGVGMGDTVAVFGAGGVGLHAVLWARYAGAGTVLAVDPLAPQREAAGEYGADLLVDPTEEDVPAAVADATDGWGVDVAVECSGATEAMAAAVEAIDGANQFESGTAVSVGLQEEPLAATYWGLREGALLVSGDHTRRELRTVLDLLGTGRVDLSPSITHEVPLADIESGFGILEDRQERVGRVIIDTTGG